MKLYLSKQLPKEPTVEFHLEPFMHLLEQNKFEEVCLIYFDNHSSNYNNHSYLIRGDDKLYILGRKDTNDFELGEPYIQSDNPDIQDFCASDYYDYVERIRYET